MTVGTHEQPFNRLVREVDRLRGEKLIEEKVVIQTGFSTYEPVFCEWSRLYPYQQMLRYVAEARIVITHGGPSSFIMPLQVGKVPVVVPRQKRFGEHVNDHQMEFCRAMAERMRNILVVEDVGGLADHILNYSELIKSLDCGKKNHNIKFLEAFQSEVEELMKRR